MNKKELRNMKLLEATDELIKLAKEDLVVMVASGVENVIGSRKNYEF